MDPDGRDIHKVDFAGVGVKLVVGGDISLGIAWDDNNNIAITLSGGLGVGLVAEVDTPITFSYEKTEGENISDLPGIGPIHVDGDASLAGVGTTAGFIVGFLYDNENKEFTGFEIGSIGGGVDFASGTVFLNLTEATLTVLDFFNQETKTEIKNYVSSSEIIPDEIKNQVEETLND